MLLKESPNGELLLMSSFPGGGFLKAIFEPDPYTLRRSAGSSSPQLNSTSSPVPSGHLNDSHVEERTAVLIRLGVGEV